MILHCKWCDEHKPAEDFIRRKTSEPYSQRNVRCCRTCNATRNRQRYESDPRVREVQLAANARWNREHRDQSNAAHERFTARNPENQQARNRIAYLLRRGAMAKQPCAVCGATEVEGHHDSYARPHWDTVRWLCKQHHEEWHQRLDPLKAPILEEPLRVVDKKRAEARQKLDAIHRLRKEVTLLQDEADALELLAWTEVQAEAQKAFAGFKSTRR